jgi:hypothetical protein
MMHLVSRALNSRVTRLKRFRGDVIKKKTEGGEDNGRERHNDVKKLYKSIDHC